MGVGAVKGRVERKEKKTKEKERGANMESPRTARTQKEIQERATTATAPEAENSREVVPTVANGGTRNQNAAAESVTRKEKEEAPMRWTKKKTRTPMQCSTTAWTTKKTGIQKKSGNPEGKQANGRGFSIKIQIMSLVEHHQAQDPLRSYQCPGEDCPKQKLRERSG